MCRKRIWWTVPPGYSRVGSERSKSPNHARPTRVSPAIDPAPSRGAQNVPPFGPSHAPHIHVVCARPSPLPPHLLQARTRPPRFYPRRLTAPGLSSPPCPLPHRRFMRKCPPPDSHLEMARTSAHRPATATLVSSRDDPKSNRVPMCRSRAHNPRTSAAPPCPLSPPSRRPPAQRGQAPHRAARDRGWLGWRLGRGGGLHRAPRALPRASPPASSARRAPLAVHPPAAGPRRGSREARASAQTPHRDSSRDHNKSNRVLQIPRPVPPSPPRAAPSRRPARGCPHYPACRPHNVARSGWAVGRRAASE